ncbi:CHAT domain-containing protein [Streptomyces poriferorum]|uniref:CHAT domain-containing protein n=2 Tax=Streptomyces TaxID=1883 RepID=UPI00273FF98A|nr:CHAT domain-containing protein [Streptomyces sp. Alt1]WLQ47105.1 CHAT domain-containing protein [Streptomyces sp. Alt1]
MSREEGGGVEGLRAWVSDAVERVKRQLPGNGGGLPSPQARDASVTELEQLARLLDHDEALRGSVHVWQAGALTLRDAAGGGTDADRERAERLLREARDGATPLGAAVTEEDRRWAALFLMIQISPVRSQQGVSGGVPDLSGVLDWIQRVGPAGMESTAAELSTLVNEAAQLPLPPELLGSLRQAQGLFAAPSVQGLSDLMTGMVPPGSPFADQFRQMMERMSGAMTPPAPAASSEYVWERAPKPEPAPKSQPQPTLTPDGLRNVVTALDAVNATAEGLDGLLASGDPHAFNEHLGRLRSAQDLPLPEGLNPVSAMESIRALLLTLSSTVGGNYQDRAAGQVHMDTVIGHLEGIRGSLPPGVGDPAVVGRTTDICVRAMAARERDDVPALRELLAEAEALGEAAPEGDPLRFAVDGALGAVLGSLGLLTQDKVMLSRSVRHVEQAMTGFKESDLPFADEPAPVRTQDFGLLHDALTGEANPVPAHVSPPPDASMEDLYSSALSLGVRFDRDRDPAVLDTRIEELERLRAGVREGRAPRVAADALWHLAESYHLRNILTEDEPDQADPGCLEAAREALSALAADVLLQAGAEHGLLAARTGASRGVQAARMAASYGRLHEAVAVLELGRALVLQGASTASAVPERLEAAGRQDLAAAWREAAGAGDGTAEAGEVPSLLPSTLRRQALDALGYRREGSLAGTPTVAELADGLADAGADVLLYLVAGDERMPGLVIAVGPEAGLGGGALPQLADVEGGPLARYVDAAAARDLHPNDASLSHAWEEALEALCDWAFHAVGPVLGGIEKRLAAADDAWEDRPLRVVLVPCGRLGIVPWHAARLPAEAAHDRLCQVAVVSCAASGSQFLRAVQRAPRDPAAAPVLVADPTMSLDYADTEVTALRDAFYPHARLCGALYEVEDGELPLGTPEAVLGFLADGASLLHVVSHGSAGVRPTVSAMDLVADEDGTPARLTVSRLLDREEQENTEDGPLVVLSACQTDLSKRDHDEALTLTTAFIAAGARDVVGSRWLAEDSGSALLMAVFHHYLAVDGLSPVDALRAAQMWMLDPHRENPGSLRGELLRESEERQGLERTALWAAFIHQGHPGPSTQDTGEGTT